MLNQMVLLVPLILHTFAAFSLCHLIYLQLRHDPLGRRSWGGWAWRAVTLNFAAYFLSYLLGYLVFVFSYGHQSTGTPVSTIAFMVSYQTIGVLIMQLFYNVERERLPRHWLWRAVLGVAWAGSVALLGVVFAARAGAPLSQGFRESLHSFSEAILAFSMFFSCVIVVMARRSSDTKFKRRQRRWYLALAAFVLFYLTLQTVWAWAWFDYFVMRFLPLVFLFVTVYYGERLVFLDVFVKRGLYFLTVLASFTACFAVMLPRVEFSKFGFMAAWVPAFILLPLVLATPWFYSRLSRWIDRAWLGRRFSPAEAAEHFLRSTQEATTEPELLETAEASLARIFRSRACIDLDDRALPLHPNAPTPGALGTPLPGALTAGFRVGASGTGQMAILPRTDEIPFLSEDTRLLTTLASSFAALLENQRLRDEKSAHVERERQLELNAARSELKALRAQINPHFLFNALGAIAGLIPQNPAQAEETVEQLAEVFRYALRRSDREWVTLAEELDFVRAHLYVEQVRFGERLRVRIAVEDDVKDVRVPAMVVQTLAENAVKHGVASVRGAGWVEVSARRQGAEVVVTVEDNGPGFPQPRPGCLPESKSGGFGLKNVQERLRAYYGEAARLELGRDDAKAATVVAIRLPATLSAAAAAQELGRAL